MASSHALLLALLFSGAFCAVSAQGASRITMMNEYLRSLNSDASGKVGVASGYAKGESVTICAQEQSRCITRLPDFSTSTLACASCPGHVLSPSENDIAETVSGGGQLGNCVWTETPKGGIIGVPGSSNVGISGTFYNTCYLKGGCGHPFCEDMVLTTTGVRYFVTNATSFSNPALANNTPSDCQPAPARVANAPAGEDAAYTASQAAASARVRYDYGSDGTFIAPANVYVGRAFVYFGVMNIASRTGGNKYDTGFFQFAVFDSWNTTTVPYISLPPGRPVFQNRGFQIQFVNSDAGKGGYYRSSSYGSSEGEGEEEDEEARR